MALTTGDVSFKVTTEALVEKAEEVSVLVRDISGQFNIIGELIHKTEGYWLGEAGETHRSMYREQTEMLEEIVRRLNEHPRDLLAIAGRYSNTEREIEEAAAGLSGNVIF